MKRSATLALGLVAAASALLFSTGCNDGPQQDVRACTDRTGRIVSDSFCQQQAYTSNGQNPQDDHILRDLLIYRWVFGGNYSGGYVTNYGYHPAPSVIYVSPGSSVGSGIVSSGSRGAYVSRGGFGGSFSGGEAGE